VHLCEHRILPPTDSCLLRLLLSLQARLHFSVVLFYSSCITLVFRSQYATVTLRPISHSPSYGPTLALPSHGPPLSLSFHPLLTSDLFPASIQNSERRDPNSFWPVHLQQRGLVKNGVEFNKCFSYLF